MVRSKEIILSSLLVVAAVILRCPKKRNNFSQKVTKRRRPKCKSFSCIPCNTILIHIIIIPHLARQLSYPLASHRHPPREGVRVTMIHARSPAESRWGPTGAAAASPPAPRHSRASFPSIAHSSASGTPGSNMPSPALGWLPARLSQRMF